MPEPRDARKFERRPKILLSLDPREAYLRDIVLGIVEYARTRGPWDLLLSPVDDEAISQLNAPLPCDGAITRPGTELHRRLMRGLKIASVIVLSEGPADSVPVINDDESAIARLALSHFRAIGLKHLAFFDHQAPPSKRCLAFKAVVERFRLPFHAFPTVETEALETWEARTKQLCEWVETIKKPIGVFCFNAANAQQLAIACGRCGVRVPEEIAIISCGGDEIECYLSRPPLTCVDLGGDRIGWAAASVLDDQLHRRKLKSLTTVMEPVGVIGRQSTDTTAVDDANVAHAIRLIRERACNGLTVGQILKQIPESRRRLEYAFRQAVGRTMQEQIMHERTQTAKHLLVRTDLSILDIAMRSGFAWGSRLTEAFTREVGITPSEFRRKQQVQGRKNV